MHIEDEAEEVRGGQAISIPAGAVQYIANRGAETDFPQVTFQQ